MAATTAMTATTARRTMTRRSTRITSRLAGAVVLGLLGLATACGGDDSVKTIEQEVLPQEDLSSYQARALQKIVETCSGENPPEEVRIVLPKEDANTEVAAGVEKLGVPLSGPCSAVRTTGAETPAESTTTSAKS